MAVFLGVEGATPGRLFLFGGSFASPKLLLEVEGAVPRRLLFLLGGRFPSPLLEVEGAVPGRLVILLGAEILDKT